MWSRNPTPGHKCRQNSHSTRYTHPYVCMGTQSSTIHNSQNNANNLNVHPTDEWTEDAEHVYSGILLGHTKRCNNAICSNMDATKSLSYFKWGEARKRKASTIWYYMWSLKCDTSESVYERLKKHHGHGEQTGGCKVGRVGCRMERERPGLADVHFYMRDGQITRPCCATQRTIINILWWTIMEGKEYEKIPHCLAESLCCATEINTI